MKITTKHNKNLTSDSGFTILELMIATSIFSIILLVAAAGILRFSHDYYKGVNGTTTQTVARSIIDDVTQNIQFGQSVSGLKPNNPQPNQAQGYCIGDNLYSFVLGQEVSPTTSGLVKTEGNCSAVDPDVKTPATLSQNDRELLSAHMRIADLRVDAVPSVSDAYTVKVAVVYGEYDLLTDKDGNSLADVASGTPQGTPAAFDWNSVHCKSDTGSQFCAVSRLSTTVQKRIL